jgi:hypothetical protein
VTSIGKGMEKMRPLKAVNGIINWWKTIWRLTIKPLCVHPKGMK